MDQNTPAATTNNATVTTDHPAPAKASKLSSVLAELEKALQLAADPAVMSLLPPRYQAYAASALVVETLIHGVANQAKQAITLANAPATLTP